MTFLAIVTAIVLYSGNGEARESASDQAITSADAAVPKVMSTSPAQGEEIAPGPFTLSVTYDRPMAERSMSFATGPNPAFPNCDGKPVQSADGRTYSMQCVAEPGNEYIVWFNYGQYRSFRSAENGRSAEPYGIAFTARN